MPGWTLSPELATPPGWACGGAVLLPGRSSIPAVGLGWSACPTSDDAGLLPSDKSLAFVQNHDTERDGSTLSYKDGPTNTLATEFLLAHGYRGTDPAGASGFSHSTGLPALIAASVSPACVESWEAMTIASTDGSSISANPSAGTAAPVASATTRTRTRTSSTSVAAVNTPRTACGAPCSRGPHP